MAPVQGVSLNVNEGSVEAVVATDGTIYASKGDGIKGKAAKIGGNLMALLAAALGGAGGGGMDKLKKAADGACGGDCSDELAGQWHHVFSEKIWRVLKDSDIGKALGRNDLLVRARDAAGHKGYQLWHRALDSKVVNWIQNNPDKSLKDFLEFLKTEYSTEEMLKRFPDAAKILDTVIKTIDKAEEAGGQ
jgi:hypothetical protein